MRTKFFDSFSSIMMLALGVTSVTTFFNQTLPSILVGMTVAIFAAIAAWDRRRLREEVAYLARRQRTYFVIELPESTGVHRGRWVGEIYFDPMLHHWHHCGPEERQLSRMHILQWRIIGEEAYRPEDTEFFPDRNVVSIEGIEYTLDDPRPGFDMA